MRSQLIAAAALYLSCLAVPALAHADHTLLLLLDESGADLRTQLRRDAGQETP